MSRADGVVRCVLFADVAGSTALYERLGDVAAKALVGAALVIVRGVVAEEGRWVKELGDGALAVFADAEAGVAAAQRARADLERAAACSMRFGLHHGRVIEEDGDVHGDAVNVAARVMALAQPSEVLLTGAVLDALGPEWRDATRALGERELDGRERPVALHELVHELARRTRPAERAPSTEEARLVLRQGPRERVLDARTPRAAIGRDAACDLVVDDDRVSRRHAEIALTRGRFVLADTSFNGTWVVPEGARSFTVRRDEIVLHGRGRIFLGEAAGPVVEYDAG
ncbi:MAG: adenylate/guanylate cyclase domain-containing protein [Planctomycetes bacterium]|nr:adenylate/guanylate cyclase domain-containing protein [Planctomycetota bacterium]